jgi:hypothetical protein
MQDLTNCANGRSLLYCGVQIVGHVGFFLNGGEQENPIVLIQTDTSMKLVVCDCEEPS